MKKKRGEEQRWIAGEEIHPTRMWSVVWQCDEPFLLQEEEEAAAAAAGGKLLRMITTWKLGDSLTCALSVKMAAEAAWSALYVLCCLRSLPAEVWVQGRAAATRHTCWRFSSRGATLSGFSPPGGAATVHHISWTGLALALTRETHAEVELAAAAATHTHTHADTKRTHTFPSER